MHALEKLKEICDKATPGPWYPCRGTPLGSLFTVNDRLACSVCTGAYKYDAEFVATARQVLPALIELVEAQGERLSNIGPEIDQRIIEARAKLEEAMK